MAYQFSFNDTYTSVWLEQFQKSSVELKQIADPSTTPHFVQGPLRMAAPTVNREKAQASIARAPISNCGLLPHTTD
jgi:hypothetical protein